MYGFSEPMQRIIELGVFIYGTPFCVITYRSYTFKNGPGFFGAPCIIIGYVYWDMTDCVECNIFNANY